MLEIIPNWHPIFVHFSVAFISLLGALQVVIWFKSSSDKIKELLFMQKALMVITSFFVLLTVYTGWLAFNSVQHDSPSHMAMTDHRNWAVSTAVVFLMSAVIYFIRSSLRSSLVGVLLIMSTLLVGVTGYKGGEIVYRYGLGVMSLPQVSESAGDGHDHEHGSSNTENSGHDGHKEGAIDVEDPTKQNKKEKPHLNDGHAH
jgi:uncharacterized membrane protein